MTQDGCALSRPCWRAGDWTTVPSTQPGKLSISHVRSRIPLVFAGLLIIALIATIGLAAFTPGATESTTDTTAIETLDMDLPISGRIASAVLALAVAPERDADLATSTTIAVAQTDSDSNDAPATEAAPDTTAATVDTAGVEEDDEAVSDTAESSDATATTSTEQVTTTNAPNTDTTPPAIQVLSPKDGATVTSRVIEFTGATERGAKVFSGPYEAEVDDGEWSINLVLAPGANGAAFTARDAAGNETTVRIVVTYDPPATATTTTTKAPSVTTTTQSSPVTTTTQAPSSGYSSLWPADAAGRRDVEAWRSDVQAHWASDRVDCVLGIIKLESGGDPTASNGGRYLGLMQHSATYWPSRAKGAGFVDSDGLVASPFNGEANIAAGAYLANYYDRIGKDWRSPWTVWSSISACQS